MEFYNMSKVRPGYVSFILTLCNLDLLCIRLIDELILFRNYKKYNNIATIDPADFSYGENGKRYIHKLDGPAAPAVFVSLVLTGGCNIVEPKPGLTNKIKTIQGAFAQGWMERVSCAIGSILRVDPWYAQLCNNSIFDFSTAMSTPKNSKSWFWIYNIDICLIQSVSFTEDGPQQRASSSSFASPAKPKDGASSYHNSKFKKEWYDIGEFCSRFDDVRLLIGFFL